MHRSRLLLLALALAVLVAGCGGDDGGDPGDRADRPSGPGAGKPLVTLGTKNFPEQFILGELYAQALRAKGWRVDLKSNIGSTEVTDKALMSGGIDLYPEYTGTTLSVVKGDTSPQRSAAGTYRKAKRFYEKRGLTLLEPTPFEDRDAIAVTREYAEANGGLRTTADLRRLGSEVTVGAAPEFRTRFAGLEGLRSEYGLDELRFQPIEIGGVYRALDEGEIEAGGVFTTDGQLASGDYVVLEDPKAIFGFQNVAPVVAKRVLDAQGPEFQRTLDAVTERLTTKVMQRMNAAVALEQREPRVVAREFLQREQLL